MRRALLSTIALLALTLLPALSSADAGSAAGGGSAGSADDAQVKRLLAARSTLKWNHGTTSRYGHAEALVAASSDDLARSAADYAHYRELHPKFATARVVGKQGDRTDVYMRYPVKIGFVRIELFEVMRFDADRVSNGTHVIEGRGLRGDMSRGHTVITVKPVDATHSLLLVDVLLDPKLPAPQVLVDEELRDGAEDFVNGLKDRAQGFRGPVVSL